MLLVFRGVVEGLATALGGVFSNCACLFWRAASSQPRITAKGGSLRVRLGRLGVGGDFEEDDRARRGRKTGRGVPNGFGIELGG